MQLFEQKRASKTSTCFKNSSVDLLQHLECMSYIIDDNKYMEFCNLNPIFLFQ